MSKITDMLNTATSRANATQALTDLNPSKADLVAAARDLDMNDAGNKGELAKRLVNGTVGARVDFAAIRSARL